MTDLSRDVGKLCTERGHACEGRGRSYGPWVGGVWWLQWEAQSTAAMDLGCDGDTCEKRKTG